MTYIKHINLSQTQGGFWLPPLPHKKDLSALDVWINGDPEARVANHLNVSFAGVDGEILLASLAKVAVSSGSACTSASVEPSYVLKAIGRSDQLAHAGLRLSVGRYTTEEEIDFAITEISRVVSLLRKQ